MGEWISVEDRLPANSLLIVIYSSAEGVLLGYYDGRWWASEEHIEIQDVILWLEIPSINLAKGFPPTEE